MAKIPRTPEQERIALFIGLQIGRARLRQGWTQAELAERMGHDYSWVNRIETGRSAIFAYDLVLLARVLQRPIDWFCDPDYGQRQNAPPTNLVDWELMYSADPQLAMAHYQMDLASRGQADEGLSPRPRRPGRRSNAERAS